eukprot:CAMPEP_0117749542 /NCGR_PEP_ID=MMETSP0947-20121206/9795_1 /TAXON_ID=44440 /ORGANISM="Chattonella subsalsa, Strain CCMP2191" /LENGTH=136 /DNA_ID=CAMNT_0005567459 /DNA_START=426 /DNA_END=836 /DNA_ORIENTATION=-
MMLKYLDALTYAGSPSQVNIHFPQTNSSVEICKRVRLISKLMDILDESDSNNDSDFEDDFEPHLESRVITHNTCLESLSTMANSELPEPTECEYTNQYPRRRIADEHLSDLSRFEHDLEQSRYEEHLQELDFEIET